MVFALETYCAASDGKNAARIEEEVIVTPTAPKSSPASPPKNSSSPAAPTPAAPTSSTARPADNRQRSDREFPGDKRRPDEGVKPMHILIRREEIELAPALPDRAPASRGPS